MSFLGILGQLGRVLPGYVEGERQAIKDNWYDLGQFNTQLNAELTNYLNATTLPYQQLAVRNQALMGDDQAAQSAMNVFGNYAGWPTKLAQVMTIGPDEAAGLAQAQYQATLQNMANSSANQQLYRTYLSQLLQNMGASAVTAQPMQTPVQQIPQNPQPVQPVSPFEIY